MRNVFSRFARAIALCGVVAVQIACNAAAEKAAAEGAVVQFHEAFNSGSYRDIYIGASDEFHKANKESDFIALLANVKAKAGRYESSRQSNWLVTSATGGTFVTLTYEVVFSQSAAVESFSWRVENGRAILYGYRVEPANRK